MSLEKDWKCPKCGGELATSARLPHWLFCLICGLAVSEEDARQHAREVANGEKA